MSPDKHNVLTMITTLQSSALLEVLEVVEVVGNLKKPIQCSWTAVTGLFSDANASLDFVWSKLEAAHWLKGFSCYFLIG